MIVLPVVSKNDRCFFVSVFQGSLFVLKSVDVFLVLYFLKRDISDTSVDLVNVVDVLI